MSPSNEAKQPADAREAPRNQRKSWAPVPFDEAKQVADKREAPRNQRKSWVPKVDGQPGSEKQPAGSVSLASMPQRGGSQLDQNELEKHLSAQVKRHDLLPTDARIVSLSPTALGQTVSVALRGAEVLVELEPVAGSANSVVKGAHTHITWPALKRCIRAALDTALNLNFSEFLDAVLSAWPKEEQDETHQQRPGALDVSTSECNDQLFFEDSRENEDAMSDVCASADEEEIPISPIGKQQIRVLPKSSTARSFCFWLNTRQPLWRFDHKCTGLGWDFPQSKAEKREFLLLSVLNESNELKAEKGDLKNEAAVLLNEVEACHMELAKYQAPEDELKA
jgi:hypothetical protein